MRPPTSRWAWLIAACPALLLLPQASASAADGEYLSATVLQVATEEATGHDDTFTIVQTADGEFKPVDDTRVEELEPGTEVVLRVADADADDLDVQSVRVVQTADAAAAEEAAAAGAATHTVRIVMAVPKGVAQDATAYTAAQAKQALAEASSYWSSQTGGAITFELVSTTPWYQSSYGCGSPWDLWNEAAGKSGFTNATRENLVVVVPRNAYTSGGCSYGLGSIGAGPDSSGSLYVTDLQSSLWAHELGHNLSLGHANALYKKGVSDVAYAGGYAGAVVTDYGDYFDVMSVSGGTVGHGNLGAAGQDRLGLQPGGIKTVTASGTYTLNALPVASDGRTYGLEVTDGGVTYYVELRGDSVGDDLAASWWRSPTKGVRVTKQDRSRTNATVVLDGSPTGVTSDTDWIVPAGSTLSSASGKLHVRTVAYDGATATVQISLTAELPGVPGPRTVTGATQTGAGTVQVTWNGADADGSAAQSQTITPFLNGVAQKTLAKTVDATATTGAVTGLAAGKNYTFAVTASNAAGPSSPGTASTAVLVAGIPSGPAGLTVTASGGRANLVWKAPATYGASVTSYVVTPFRDGKAQEAFPVTGTSTAWPLPANGAYRFAVVARNVVGSSAAVSSVAMSYVAPTAPAAPVAPKVVNSLGVATVSWAAPKTSTPITGYSVAVTRDGEELDPVTTTTTTAKVPLEGGHTYAFAVTAVNAQGPSAASKGTSLVVPTFTAPVAPAAPKVVNTEGVATVTWVAPKTSTPITGYRVAITRDGVAVDPIATTGTSATLPLAGGHTYGFAVTATNQQGDSTGPKATALVVPVFTAPVAPAAPKVVNTQGVATISWAAPRTSTPITGYDVVVTRDGEVLEPISTTTTTAKVPLEGGRTYTFAVTATNEQGTSATPKVTRLVVAAFTAPAKPAAPTAVLKTGVVTLGWKAPASSTPVTGYEVVVTRDGEPVAGPTVAGAATTAAFPVEKGHTYGFAVRAVNAQGAGEASVLKVVKIL